MNGFLYFIAEPRFKNPLKTGPSADSRFHEMEWCKGTYGFT